MDTQKNAIREIIYRCPICDKYIFKAKESFELNVKCSKCGAELSAKGTPGNLVTIYSTKPTRKSYHE